ncbi:YkyA family protein [Neobacillus mesonae]|uniref:YkyA family protein n=1 Tax=Neobacillus mesonae TaxID=1193713 RepID=UPI00203E2808|nr:YkyA family protein [Neobacillus mesonae]MCM3569416.1 YkyA family protein [Neobacillus mesonae]
MNRFIVVTIILGLAVFLTGCDSDEKQAGEIHQKMEESASFEKEFAMNQKELENNRKKAQSVYNNLMNLDINDTDAIKQKLDDANIYIKKQQKSLREAEVNFQKAYTKSASIKENAKKIQDKNQKKQAAKLMKLIDDRKKIIDTFFDEYHNLLKLQTTFYEDLGNRKYNVDKFNQQINEINKYGQNMKDIIQQFNQYTEQYNEVENEYYKLAELI